MSFITDVLSLSNTPRWAIVRMLRPQSVAEHSYNVTMIALELARRHPDLDPIMVRPFNLAWNALVHDVDECVTGDIPSPAKAYMRSKRDVPKLVDTPEFGMSIVELKLIKLADLIDAYTYCRMNSTGNHSEQVANHLMRLIHEHTEDFEVIDSKIVWSLVTEIWSEEGRLRTGGVS